MLLFSLTLSPVAGLSSVNILPPGGKPYGLPYAEQIKNFWKWSIGIPAKDNPVNDPTGEKCEVGQNSSSPLFYLSFNNGGFSQRTCKVPAGKALFIPVLESEVSQKEFPKAQTDQDLSKATALDAGSANSLYFKIGDKEYNYQDLLKYRTHTDAFNLNFANNGLFGIIQGGPTRAVADGYYVMTEPLAKGTYPIHIKASLICLQPDCVDPNFAKDITYTVIAQ
ncbi:MAG: hypothetical protein WA364_27010 [Candidatus Nitrosopolaris sp.]